MRDCLASWWLALGVAMLATTMLSHAPAHAQEGPDARTQQATPRPRSGREGDANDKRIGRERRGFDTVGTGLVARELDSLTQLEGKPIRAISVETAGSRWPARHTVRSVAVGTPLSAAVARRAVKELLDTGEYAQAHADARPYEDGAILRVVVLPRRIARVINVTGGALDRVRVLNAAALADGADLTEPRLEQAITAIRQLHRRYGYDDAKVSVEIADTDDPMEVLISIDITAGEARTITRRIFVIEPKFDRVVGELKSEYAVESGERIDEDALLEADNELADLLRTEGFLQTSVKHRVLRRGKSSFLYVYLETGPQFRFQFIGNRRYDDSELKDALGLEQSGSDDSPEALSKRLLIFYQERGLYDVRVVATERSAEDGAVQELNFRIFEGNTVRVSKRILPCLPKTNEELSAQGLTAEALSSEINAFLEQELPSTPLLHAVEDAVVDKAFKSDGGGSRADARRLDPAVTFVPEVYERAVKHLEKLLNSKGYLNAVVGPVSIIRAECNPEARAGRCDPLDLPKYEAPLCRNNALELPIPEEPLPDPFTCKPDPLRGIHCAPNMTVHIPVQLGPKTVLYDVIFEGNEDANSRELLYGLGVTGTDVLPELRLQSKSDDARDSEREARVELLEALREKMREREFSFDLGQAFSQDSLDAAQQGVLEYYRNLGYAYASVRADVDYSPDRTRARARFIINEHEPVEILGYQVRGAVATNETLILRRLALCPALEDCNEFERRYRELLVPESEEQVATLGPFSSVSVSLEAPEIPQKQKNVIISVVEQNPQYIEPRIGFSTGEGFRIGVEYGHRNIAGEAISLTLRFEFAYLPDFLILDGDVRETYEEEGLQVSDRLEQRHRASLRFPDVGLGPRVDVVLDGLFVRDNLRDFGLTRGALIPALGWRPTRGVTTQLSVSAELNDVTLFNDEDIDSAIARNEANAFVLRVPEGRTAAFSERIVGSWDRRDNPLAATTGTFFTLGVEHVTALPLEDDEVAHVQRVEALPDGCTSAPRDISSEFLKLTGQAAGYIRLTDAGLALALSLRGGYNVQLRCWSQTYPDRLFYLGGVNSVRGFQLDSMTPEDIAQKVLRGELSIDDVGVRGGNVFVNPRAELRVPLTDVFGVGLFLDTGNVWSKPEAIEGIEDLFALRYTAGAGLRLTTPIGPITIDYGFKLVRRDWEDVGAFHLAIGLF
jgi:outer membrane protein insertion porin family